MKLATFTLCLPVVILFFIELLPICCISYREHLLSQYENWTRCCNSYECRLKLQPVLVLAGKRGKRVVNLIREFATVSNAAVKVRVPA